MTPAAAARAPVAGTSPAIGPAAATTRIGLIGLGLVGSALGARLVDAGFEVLGYDRSPAASDAWQRAGGRTATSLPELGESCPQIVLAVFDTAGVLDVIEGPAGILSLGLPEAAGSSAPAAQAKLRAFIDCSTGDPAILEALAARLAARSLDFIEAPLSGSSQQIAAGRATMLLGGDTTAIERHGALLQALSPQRLHVGGAGMGARAKLATNLVLGLNRAALAEGLVFAEKLGMTPATFLELVLATPARSEAALAKGERMVRGDFMPAQSRIHQHLKDLQLMLEAARATGQRLPLTETHAALLRAALAAGDGELDNAAIVRQLRRETL
jgi:3-hydroxyisobutyrate dehydrogenase-like beta-hydroxyacid dehydrogenase